MRNTIPILALAALSVPLSAQVRHGLDDAVPPGALIGIPGNGEPGTFCPLKHTSVKAEITGPLSRVTVEQQFQNPFGHKIEAVYTFPLPSDAAVDEMTMLIGDRTVHGKIKGKEEARAIYESAKRAGHATSLLEQERPNIFTQAIANILPGENVKIVIRYVETVKYEDGNYEFSFPMVVGPRYNPRGTPSVNPPVTAKGTRAGHDISVEVSLDAGVPVNFLRSLTHDVDIQQTAPSKALVALRNKNELPNKDFILQYDVSGAKIADAVMTHRGPKGGFFSMILQPPAKVATDDITPKELVFVLDTSGSMMGFPIEKAKESMKAALAGLNPRDTFNLITFSGDTYVLFPKPVPATPHNLSIAQTFLTTLRGGGGTEMMKAIKTALDPSDAQDHVRVVCFMTDGYVGNDMEIIGEIKRHPNARVFSFGIGTSVNHFLLDQMAREGRGEVEYVGLGDDGTIAARRFHERVRSPLLTDLRLEWNGVAVSEVYPARLPDLFDAKPLVVSGRYDNPGKGVLRLRGKQAGRDFVRDIAIALPASQGSNEVLATLWARRKVDDLMSQDWMGVQQGNPRAGIKEAITKVGVDFGLMTQFTSFVAVEESIRTEGGISRRVEVPVEMPEGVSYEGVFGERESFARFAAPSGIMGRPMASAQAVPFSPPARMTDQIGQIGGREIKEKDVKAEIRSDSRKIDAVLAGATGKVQVRVWLDDASEETLAKLKAAGFNAKGPAAGRYILGEIDSAKLADLAKVQGVRYISKA
jgi:Ca-activated chloride channel family protein